MGSVEHEVKFSATKNTAGYFALRAVVPRALMARIDEPSRVAVIGTPHEGYVIEPTKKTDRGTYAVSYKASPHIVTLTLPFLPTKLSKVTRRIVAVAARIKDGKIRVGGMPPEWIKAEAPWIEASAANGANGVHHRVPAKLGSGTIITTANGNGAAEHHEGTAPQPRADKSLKIGPEVADDQLRARLAVTLRHVGALKAELEKRSGLKLRITRDLHLVVDLE